MNEIQIVDKLKKHDESALVEIIDRFTPLVVSVLPISRKLPLTPSSLSGTMPKRYSLKV